MHITHVCVQAYRAALECRRCLKQGYRRKCCDEYYCNDCYCAYNTPIYVITLTNESICPSLPCLSSAYFFFIGLFQTLRVSVRAATSLWPRQASPTSGPYQTQASGPSPSRTSSNMHCIPSIYVKCMRREGEFGLAPPAHAVNLRISKNIWM